MQRPDFERLTVDKILIEACIIYTLFTYLCAGNQYRVNATGPMKIPQTIEMQVGALNASEHNPRQITEDDFAELVKSLLLLPKGLYYRPVVVDDRNIALAGNMRLRALKYIHELGFDDLAEILRASYRFRHFDEAKQSALLNYWREWQMHPTVPTLYASELDEDEQQQFIIKDNLSFGTFDIDMLANEYDIAAIIDDGFDIDLLPKSAIEALAAANGIDPNDITGRRCGGDGEADEHYTHKITSPVYEPKNEKPDLSTLTDSGRTDELLAKIEASNVSPDEKEFLRQAAARHTVFDYAKIADYHAHASKEMQELMEDSALVIIDFGKAIEKGYIRLSDEIRNEYTREYGNEA